MGYQYVYTGVTSAYMIALCKKLNFKQIYELKYADYLDEDNKPIFQTEPPHTSFGCFIKEL